MSSMIVSLFLSVALAVSVSIPAITPEKDPGGGKETVTADVEQILGDWAAEYIEAYLDITYKGKIDGYPEFFGRQKAREMYEANIRGEAWMFLYGYGIPPLDDSADPQTWSEAQQLRAEALYQEIYAKADYTVDPAVKRSDGTFVVTVRIRPLDIMKLVDDGYDAGFEEFWPKIDGEIDDAAYMSDEELEDWYTGAFASAYHDFLLDLLEAQLPHMGYSEERTLEVALQWGEDGELWLEDEEFSRIDEIIIDYGEGSVEPPQEVEILYVENAEEVTLTTQDMTFLSPGETYQMKFYYPPGDVVALQIGGERPKWTSSDPNVASVSWNGNVTAVGPGVCDITAEVTLGEEERIFYFCTVRCRWK